MAGIEMKNNLIRHTNIRPDRMVDTNEAEGSGSKNIEHDVEDERDVEEKGWLQLGVGGSFSNPTTQKSELIELDLLAGCGGGGSSHQVIRSLQPPPPPPPVLSLMPGQRPVSNFRNPSSTSYGYGSTFSYPGETNWEFRPIQHEDMAVASSTSFSSLALMPRGSYFTRQFDQLHAGILDVAAGPSLDFRIIDPPKRPHSGLWFMLRASQNQARKPILPQIRKSYLRIKNGTMTVRMLMKYLAIKLKLDTDSEIKITCKGQPLLPFLTLQHVRDHIWSSRDDLVTTTLLPPSSTTHHLMLLHYTTTA